MFLFGRREGEGEGEVGSERVGWLGGVGWWYVMRW